MERGEKKSRLLEAMEKNLFYAGVLFLARLMSLRLLLQQNPKRQGGVQGC